MERREPALVDVEVVLAGPVLQGPALDQRVVDPVTCELVEGGGRDLGLASAFGGWGPLPELDELQLAGQPALCTLPGGECHAGAVQLSVRPGVTHLEPPPGLYDGSEIAMLRLG